MGIFHRREQGNFDIPVGCIPAGIYTIMLGSANGMSKVICNESGEENNTPETCAYIVCKGQYRSIDVVEMELLSLKKKIYSFLTLTWGIISDIDIESET